MKICWTRVPKTLGVTRLGILRWSRVRSIAGVPCPSFSPFGNHYGSPQEQSKMASCSLDSTTEKPKTLRGLTWYGEATEV